jgi:hypothetical protein
MDPSACGLISTRLRTTQKFDLWQFLTTFKTNAKDCMSLLLYANKVYRKLIADTYIIYKKYLTKMI